MHTVQSFRTDTVKKPWDFKEEQAQNGVKFSSKKKRKKISTRRRGVKEHRANI
jgi:hypothetical protein